MPVHVHIEVAFVDDNLYLFISQFLISVYSLYVSTHTVSEDDSTMSTTRRERIEMSLREDMIIISYKCKNSATNKPPEPLRKGKKEMRTITFNSKNGDNFTLLRIGHECLHHPIDPTKSLL